MNASAPLNPGTRLISTAPCTAVVDLDAIGANLTLVRELVGDDVEIMTAVKANAYGHGAVAVALHLESVAATQWLGVATVAEGEQLRAAGVGLPVLKLSHCLDDELDRALAADLTLTVVDAATIAAAQAAASRAGRAVRVHLKLDTGMGRIGSPTALAVQLVALVDASDHLDLDGVFTHLPVADSVEGVDFTTAELDLFEQTVTELVRLRGPIPRVHAANSANILTGNRPLFTLVRPGIVAYGQSPDPSNPVLTRGRTLRPALTWRTRVTFVKHVEAGTSISYGRTWVAPRDTHIATLAVGYGDGFNRLNSNRGRVLIGGRSFPVVGRVCMDQTMVDLGPEPPGVRPGDPVTLIGVDGDESINADELAALEDTISYEVLTAVSPRVQRLHVTG